MRLMCPWMVCLFCLAVLCATQFTISLRLFLQRVRALVAPFHPKLLICVDIHIRTAMHQGIVCPTLILWSRERVLMCRLPSGGC